MCRESLLLTFFRKGVRKALPSTLVKWRPKRNEAFLDRRRINEFWPEARKLLQKASCSHLERLQGRLPVLQHAVTLGLHWKSGQGLEPAGEERSFSLQKGPWPIGSRNAQRARHPDL